MPTEDTANKNSPRAPALHLPQQPEAKRTTAPLPCAKVTENPQEDSDSEDDFFENMPV